jgi:hypothetical protein
MFPNQGQQSHNLVGGGKKGAPQVHGTNMICPMAMDGNFTSLQIGGGVYPPLYPNHQQYPVQYSQQPMQYIQHQYAQNSQFYTMPSSAPYPTTQSHHAEQVLQMVSDLNQSNHAQSGSALPLLETCEQAGAFSDKAQEDEFMKYQTSTINLF